MKEVAFGRTFAGAGAEAGRSTVSERGSNPEGCFTSVLGYG